MFFISNKEKFYKKYIEKDFNDTYVPKVFEDICKQYLIRKNLRNELEESFGLIGKYYYDDPKTKTNGEFDVVTEDETGYIHIRWLPFLISIFNIICKFR